MELLDGRAFLALLLIFAQAAYGVPQNPTGPGASSAAGAPTRPGEPLKAPAAAPPQTPVVLLEDGHPTTQAARPNRPQSAASKSSGKEYRIH